MNKPLLIYGSQEFGKIVCNLAIECGYEVAGFIDDYNSGENILGSYDYVKDKFPPTLFDMAIAIGYKHLESRWAIYQQVKSDGYFLPSLVHGSAYVSCQSTVHAGGMIMAGAIVDAFVKVNDLVVLWPGVVVNHDSSIGSNTFLSPNATVCGFVKIGHSCFVGAGATVVDHRNVADFAFIKAGSVYK